MSSYFEVLQRAARQNLDAAEDVITLETPAEPPPAPRPLPASSVTQLPIAPSIVGNIARDRAIRRLTERVAPLAALGNPVRLLVSGCRPGDGASSVAGGIALDLSQRLGLRTVLMDLHFRHPTLQRLFASPEGAWPAANALVNVRPTRWSQLALGTCHLPEPGAADGALAAQIDQALDAFPLAVVDFGVLRLDARMLALARPGDAILLVVRYGHTERAELATTVSALRAANRALAGVIFNAARSSLPPTIRRIFGTGVRNEF
ncbi:MAG TPA: hypothetical protein VKV28_01130 [Candidatus Binataceae bacterium]|nr:hypothetical protein [Candidatus Binataceae bacterium]